MKAKLIKIKDGYELFTQGFLKGSTNHELIDSLNAEEGNIRYKLSLKNCQTIERGYDLYELAEMESEQSLKIYPENSTLLSQDEVDRIRTIVQIQTYIGFKHGFQKRDELMGDKKFSEEDVRLMLVDMARFIATKELRDDWDLDVDNFFRKRDFFIDKQIQSLQKTEWEVEIVMINSRTGKIIKSDFDLDADEDGLCDRAIPKIDSDGCIILKRL